MDERFFLGFEKRANSDWVSRYQEIAQEPIRSREDYKRQARIAGGVAGGVAGGLSGGALGGAFKGWKGGIAGGLLGAGVGGILGAAKGSSKADSLRDRALERREAAKAVVRMAPAQRDSMISELSSLHNRLSRGEDVNPHETKNKYDAIYRKYGVKPV